MHLDRPAIKAQSKITMRSQTPSMFYVTGVFIIILLVMNLLENRLAGFNAEFIKAASALAKDGVLAYEDLFSIIPQPSAFARVLIMLMTLMRGMLDYGYKGYCFRVTRGTAVGYKDIFSCFEDTLHVFGIYIISGFFIVLWSLLLVIPGIIAAYRYSMAIYVHFDNPDLSALECIRQSKAITQGRKGELFVLDLSFIGWHLLDVFVQFFIAVPIVSLYLLPYSGITWAEYYNSYVGYVPAEPAGQSYDDVQF